MCEQRNIEKRGGMGLHIYCVCVSLKMMMQLAKFCFNVFC